LPQYDLAKRPDTKVSDPTETPVICEPPTDGFWPEVCWSDFVTYTEISENNYKLAKLNTDSLRDSQAGYDRILSSAQKGRDIAMIREDMLQAERKDHFFDNVKNGIIIIVGVLAAVL